MLIGGNPLAFFSVFFFLKAATSPRRSSWEKKTHTQNTETPSPSRPSHSRAISLGSRHLHSVISFNASADDGNNGAK